jgi:hypothetical protein
VNLWQHPVEQLETQQGQEDPDQAETKCVADIRPVNLHFSRPLK